MEISNLTFIVTDDCNFNCSYCFQKKENKTIDDVVLEEAVDFFYPFLTGDKIHIGFYGGEPLLAYDKIKHAVLLLDEKNKRENKKLAFSVTTNGTLLTDEMLDFFNRHRFSVTLSFDGLAQEKGRKAGTLEGLVELMKKLREYPGIHLEINSVFSPRTVADFFESMRFLILQEGPEITFNISTMEEWEAIDLDLLKTELRRLGTFLVSYYGQRGTIPVKNFQAVPGRGVFRCGAGTNRMAVTPEGRIWGCFLFHDFFKTRPGHHQYRDFSFGTLADFTAHHRTRYPGIVSNYSELRQDFFQVGDNFCFLCRDVEGCAACPLNAAYSSGCLGKISCRKCNLLKIQGKALKDFHQQLNPPSGTE